MHEESILVEVLEERARQVEKWGVQNHPSFDKRLTVWDGGAKPESMAAQYEIPSEKRAKFLCQWAEKNGDLTWMHIAVEELAEACGACNDKPARLREELIQLQAVLLAWVACLDRNGASRP